MEKHIIHPTIGYTVLVGDAAPAPAGSIEVPPRPSEVHVWNGQWEIDPALQSAKDADDLKTLRASVNLERDRRITRGGTFTVSGGVTLRIAGDPQTRSNLGDVAQIAMSGLVTDFSWRDEDDTIHSLTASQVIELYAQAVGFVDAVYKAAWALKDNPQGIPADFRSDQYWP